MSLESMSQRLLEKLPRRIATRLHREAKRIPAVRRTLERQYHDMLADAPAPQPAADVPVYRRLPAASRTHEDILRDIAALASAEEVGWRAGKASGAVYHGDADHIEFLSRVYALQSQSNPLHTDLWPSGMKFEAEVVSMTATMLGGDDAGGDDIVGTLTSGGTESIIMAMKAHRDRAGITSPEMVLPISAHVAFDKAAQLLGYRQRRIPVGPDGRADVAAAARAIGRRTVVVVGSAPSFPHGAIDPIPELSELARERGVGFHTDACLGGFVIPWAEQLGYDVPVIDFRLPGVSSMSADTHKYGYAPKGTSVVLYRGRDLRRHQFHVATEWPGGLYYSPALAGSRPGGLIAGAWAALLSMGTEGYRRATESILTTAAVIRAGIEEIRELRIIGDPLWVIAFSSDTVDIYEVMAQMGARGLESQRPSPSPRRPHRSDPASHPRRRRRRVSLRSAGLRQHRRRCGRRTAHWISAAVRHGSHVPGAGRSRRPHGSLRRPSLRALRRVAIPQRPRRSVRSPGTDRHRSAGGRTGLRRIHDTWLDDGHASVVWRHASTSPALQTAIRSRTAATSGGSAAMSVAAATGPVAAVVVEIEVPSVRSPIRETPTLHDPREGVTSLGTIETGVRRDRVPALFEPVLDASVAAIRVAEPDASLYVYGSVATGMARPGRSDVDLLTVGIPADEAAEIGRVLSARFEDLCRGVEVAAALPADFSGESDAAYGGRVFLRHYCIHLSGRDICPASPGFAADVRAARGFNGDIAEHARRWRHELAAGSDPARLGRRVARKSLFAVSGLVSVHDDTWTTDRRAAAARSGRDRTRHRRRPAHAPGVEL